MADRKPTVLNPAGYQENLQDTDNLVVEAAPTADNHAVNKGYADTEIAEAGKWKVTGDILEPKDGALEVKVGSFNYADATTKGTVISNLGGVDIKIATGNTQDALTTWLGNDSKIQLKFDGSAAFPGNVGIGTNAPSANLEVNGEIGIASSAGGYRFLSAVNGAVRGGLTSTNSNDLEIRVNNGEVSTTFLANGKVGIGTDSPTSVLQVSSVESTFYDATASDGQADKGATLNIDLRANSNSGIAQILFTQRSTNELARIVATGGTSPALAFTTNTSEKMRINSAGNVGIGTDSPTSPLTVDAGSISQAVEVISATPNARIKLSDGDATTGAFVTGIGNALKFETGGSNSRMFIDSNGNVGIGIDAPSGKLDVQNGANRAIKFEVDGTSGDNHIKSYQGNSENVRNLRITGQEIAIDTNSSGESQGVNRIKVLTNGNVGIGTDSPVANLEISNAVETGVPTLFLDRSPDQTDTSDIALRANSVIRSEYSIKSVVNTGGVFGWYVGGSDVKAGLAGASEVMKIDANGNLDVLGTISADNFDIGGITKDSYLRSDADDSASGNLTFNGRTNIRGNLDISDGQNVDFGSSDDIKFYYQGSNDWLYCDFKTAGNGIIFKDAGTDKIVLEDSGVFRPATNNTGTVGNSSYYWNNGYFKTFNVSSTLNVRGAIDLADNDKIRFGSGDDTEMYYNGSHTYIDLKTEGNFYIRDGTTSRFFVTKAGNATLSGKLTAGNFDLESLPALP